MKKFILFPLALIGAAPSPPALSPNEIVSTAKADEWVTIASSDLLVMDLAADRDGKPRRVVIQLMPAPFSQGWVGNIRKLAAAQWWDGTSVNRVQDNYVVQWGDATEKKALPGGLTTMEEIDYSSSGGTGLSAASFSDIALAVVNWRLIASKFAAQRSVRNDTYASKASNILGWPIAFSKGMVWPVHCYGMVGVGRNLSPDTGSGAELYTVIGHAPRHLDRNIALVGRVVSGIEHLSSLPRGTGDLGFYKTEAERVPILSVRMGTEVSDLAKFEYLSTESASFARYADARANRRDAFFITPAGGADICNIPVPVRVGK